MTFEAITIRKNAKAPGFRFTVWDVFATSNGAEVFVARVHKLALAESSIASDPRFAALPLTIER